MTYPSKVSTRHGRGTSAVIIVANLFLTVTQVVGQDFTASQIEVVEQIALAQVAVEHCPKYKVNRLAEAQEVLGVRLKREDLVGREFGLAKARAGTTFTTLSLKHRNVCHYLYVIMGDHSDYPY